MADSLPADVDRNQQKTTSRRAVLRTAAAKTFESLRVRDFRILWLGFMGSWFAMQMQQVARGYLAFVPSFLATIIVGGLASLRPSEVSAGSRLRTEVR
jgi:hypothetical protein